VVSRSDGGQPYALHSFSGRRRLTIRAGEVVRFGEVGGSFVGPRPAAPSSSEDEKGKKARKNKKGVVWNPFHPGKNEAFVCGYRGERDRKIKASAFQVEKA